MSRLDSSRSGWEGLYRAGGLGVIVAGVLVLVTLPMILILVPSLAPLQRPVWAPVNSVAEPPFRDDLGALLG